MPKRKRQPSKPLTELHRATVHHAAIRVSAIGPDVLHHRPNAEADTHIDIEATLQCPVANSIHHVGFSIFPRDDKESDPGTSISLKPVWRVVVYLPRPQFQDLAILVATKSLQAAEFAAERPKWGKGTVRSVSFTTEPVEPLEELAPDICTKKPK